MDNFKILILHENFEKPLLNRTSDMFYYRMKTIPLSKSAKCSSKGDFRQRTRRLKISRNFFENSKNGFVWFMTVPSVDGYPGQLGSFYHKRGLNWNEGLSFNWRLIDIWLKLVQFFDQNMDQFYMISLCGY